MGKANEKTDEKITKNVENWLLSFRDLAKTDVVVIVSVTKKDGIRFLSCLDKVRYESITEEVEENDAPERPLPKLKDTLIHNYIG